MHALLPKQIIAREDTVHYRMNVFVRDAIFTASQPPTLSHRCAADTHVNRFLRVRHHPQQHLNVSLCDNSESSRASLLCDKIDRITQYADHELNENNCRRLDTSPLRPPLEIIHAFHGTV